MDKKEVKRRMKKKSLMDRHASYGTTTKYYEGQKNIQSNILEKGKKMSDQKKDKPQWGGYREGSGRPALPKKEKKSNRRLYRWSEEEHKLILKAIELENKHNDSRTKRFTESQLIRESVMKEVDRILAHYHNQ